MIVLEGLVAYYHYQQGVDITNLIWANIAPDTLGQYDGFMGDNISLDDKGVYFHGDLIGSENNYVEINGLSELEQFTFEIALEYSVDDNYVLINYQNSTECWVRIEETGVVAYRESGFLGDTIETPPGTIVSNELQILTITYDGSQLNIYINGEVKASESATIPGILSPVYIGEREILGGSTLPYMGYVYSFRFYDRVLSEAEIEQNVNNGKNIGLPGDGGFHGTSYFDSLQVIYKSGVLNGDSKQSFYSKGSKSFDALQKIIDTGLSGGSYFDSLQIIYRDGSLKGDSKQSIYAEGATTFDTLQRILEQGIRGATYADTKQVIYADGIREADLRQAIYKIRSVSFDTVQSFYEADKTLIGVIELEGVRGIVVELKGVVK